MAWRVLPIVIGFCLLFFSYGEENESHAELQRAKLDPVSMAGPGAVHQDEAAVFGLELKNHNPDIMQMFVSDLQANLNNYRPRPRRLAEKKKKKHNTGAFSPISMSQDGKKTNNSRTKRQGNLKVKNTIFVNRPLKHEQKSPREKKHKVPKRKQVKKPQPPGVFSALSYTTQDKERSGGQIDDMDD